jgi:hypothetical protein
MLYTDEAKRLLKFLKNNPDFDAKAAQALGASRKALEPRAKNQEPASTSIADYARILSLLYEELYQGLELNELHYEAARLQARLVDHFIKQEKLKISEQLETADHGATRQLLETAKKYDELLNQVKGAADGQS